MFKPMRRKDRQISERESYEILKKGEYGFLGTIGLNGYPSCTPLNYVVGDNCIYVHLAIKGGAIIECVSNNNNKVSFTHVDKINLLSDEFVTNYESVMAFGTAEIVEDVEKRKALTMFIDKYSSNFKDEGMKHVDEDFNNSSVVKINIEHITGKARRG